MLRTNRLKAKLRSGEPQYGLLVSIPNPIVVEMAAYAGYDFVIIDLEHVMVNPESLENMIRAAEAADIVALVRVPDVNPKLILQVLDGGAQGIVVPHVESAEQARQLVRAARYGPVGARSLNAGRPGAFGKVDLVDYLARANAEIMLVPMIESRAGVANVEEILAVPGMDMVLEGAADLSQSCGVPWQAGAPVVREQLRHVLRAAQRQGVPYCAIPRAEDDHAYWRENGASAFVLGNDRGIAFRALQARLAGLKSQEHDRG
ncbi:HpcH/HpaI aldolase/citrate lyase family protein [Micromonospora sp. HUAS LYJ1]|uniref:HpcH/HpaI aldolase family protein n=1 Tax=Micromonospora sp. HUAS LYJ1 TaxID=3061626 RepID=UPI0026715C64|nr:aldolase/citrate lyase family protein [Micromonospora sp. HUAS LYJ1]WKU07135.1 aldolase/citrate lyase family protein [Micromonospora sp. HUAS LYJ1]